MEAGEVVLSVILALTLLAVPLPAAAQQPGKVYRIGYLGVSTAGYDVDAKNCPTTGHPNWQELVALPSNKLNATARTLSATIRQAKTLAQIHNEGKTVFIDLDLRKYGIEGLGSKDIPPEISIKVVDPMSGEILKGTYEIAVHSGGGVEGGTIQLWTPKKAVSIQIDPVVGAVVIK